MSDRQIFKAFRPSRMAGREEVDEHAQVEKEAKMAMYVVRAQAGLPLFDSSFASPSMRAPKKLH